MSHRRRSPLQELDDEIPISRSVQRVLRDRVEPKFFGEEVSIDSEGVSSEGTATEREDGDSREKG